MKIRPGRTALALFLLAANACGSGGGGGASDAGGDPLADRTLQGGDTTSSDRTVLAFEHPASNLSGEQDDQHREGDGNFGAIFVTPPATVQGGLGPVFNNNSCDSCHTKNGRGQAIFGTGPRGSQALVRVSLAAGTSAVPGGPVPVPGLGVQLQDHGTFGIQPEGTVSLSYKSVPGSFADGTPYELREPIVAITSAGGRPLANDVLTSLRAAPPVFGLGLLEAVPADEIEALADPGDANGDGISGRVNHVWDPETQSTVVGRFGRKANTGTLRVQAATAYAEDIGVTNPLFPAPDGSTEITDDILRSVEFYVQSIAVPSAGRVSDPVVQQGGELFKSFGCAGCHVPRLTTAKHKLDVLSDQTIFPYTDLLVHDMGAALADNRPDFEATGTEWKTPPLWGIGITSSILSVTATFLHDGRARTLDEAILWHGGEAENAKEQFRTAPKASRDALIEFLRSL